MNCDSIIFDLDGTLWDAVDNILISWNKAIEGTDLAPITKEALTACMGLKMDAIAERLFEGIDYNGRMAIMEKCSDYELDYLTKHGAAPFDGVIELIKLLSKRYKLFICSNCQKGYIECFLDYYDLRKYFTDIECWGNTGLSKGENNKLLIERNSLKAPIYVGDTDGDRISAEVAGIPFVFAAYGFGSTDKYDFVINTPTELINLLEIKQ
jgi:phosphoglycolate phosphatase